jgi:hypothetical protein
VIKDYYNLPANGELCFNSCLIVLVFAASTSHNEGLLKGFRALDMNKIDMIVTIDYRPIHTI